MDIDLIELLIKIKVIEIKKEVSRSNYTYKYGRFNKYNPVTYLIFLPMFLTLVIIYGYREANAYFSDVFEWFRV